ncbi:hypothetical protein [Enterobacter phage 01_vB_Eclo_IJM]|nr:hypothetical protein [Enterobacter phage 01_vB_Eclo_IJM]
MTTSGNSIRCCVIASHGLRMSCGLLTCITSGTRYSKLHTTGLRLKTVREGLMDVLMALDACANFGSDIQFEISPRNVRAVNGKLILVDCFFLVSKLQEVRSSKW